ncbi:MAG TPA: hypothetical protein VG960_02585, partial [Caulobacteraceae bacterium]|nr:hypothetical protein [Caulobacteraceae bacterium]
EEAAAAGGKVKRHADAAVAMVMSGFALRQGVAAPIDFQSAGRTGLPGEGGVINEDVGFGAVTSELQLQGF